MEGFIFTCNRDTYRECIQKKVFGLPSRSLREVASIKPTTPLFLFNASTKELLCGFEASGYGGMNICASAFRGRFPAQVRVNILEQPVSLTSNQYRCVGLKEDQVGKLKQKLGPDQVMELLNLAGLGCNGLDSRGDKQITLGTKFNSSSERSNRNKARELSGETKKRARIASPILPSKVKADKQEKPPEEAAESIDLCLSGQDRFGSDRTTAESGNPIPGIADASGRSDAGSILGECIDAEAVLNWGWRGETRTTVAVHPLPDPSKLTARKIVNILDVCSRDCYRFLYIKEQHRIGRVLHIDFFSVSDVMKFRCGVAGRTWEDLTGSNCTTGEKITVRFWDKCQGLEKLRAAFVDNLYLHVGEPYCCSKLADDVPIFFMQTPKKDPLAAASINDRLQTHAESPKKCATESLACSIQASKPTPCSSRILVNRFDFHSLYKRMEDRCNKQDKLEEELRRSIVSDIAQLREIKQVLHTRYDPSSLLPEDGALMFKNTLQFVDEELSKQEDEMSDLDILG